jgi:hypothetical protein
MAWLLALVSTDPVGGGGGAGGTRFSPAQNPTKREAAKVTSGSSNNGISGIHKDDKYSTYYSIRNTWWLAW